MKRFRGGLVFKARRLLYHSTPGSRVIKKRTDSLNSRLESSKEEEEDSPNSRLESKKEEDEDYLGQAVALWHGAAEHGRFREWVPQLRVGRGDRRGVWQTG